MTGLAPGDYKLYAFEEEADVTSYIDPKWAKPLETAGRQSDDRRERAAKASSCGVTRPEKELPDRALPDRRSIFRLPEAKFRLLVGVVNRKLAGGSAMQFRGTESAGKQQ
jgi:hypothetical protein